jgi:TetR/AcrR family transcriptional repressor of nem operon
MCETFPVATAASTSPKHAGGQHRAPQTADRVLDSAERLVQERGFNGFSYADIAAELGITKASLHYHFRGKAELGEALIERYTARFGEALERIDASGSDLAAKLDAYVDLHAEVLKGRRMCLCGMLAAEFRTLPGPMQEAVRRFFELNESWVAGLVESGRAADAAPADPRTVARTLVGGLQGAMLVARTDGDLERFRATAAALAALARR